MAPLKTYGRNSSGGNRSRMDIIHNILAKPIEKKKKRKIIIKDLPPVKNTRSLANNSSPKLRNNEQNSFDKLLNMTNYHQVNFKSKTGTTKHISGNRETSIQVKNIVHTPIIAKQNLRNAKVKIDPMQFVLRSPILTRSRSKSTTLDSSTNVSKSFDRDHLKTLEKSVNESLCIEKVKDNKKAKSIQFTLSSDENVSEILDCVNDSSINVSYDKIFSKPFKRNDAFSSTPLISIPSSKVLSNTISPIDNINNNNVNDLKGTPRIKRKSARRSRIMHDECENMGSDNRKCDKENLNNESEQVENDCKAIKIYHKHESNKQLMINLTNLPLIQYERKENLKKFFDENNITVYIDPNCLPTVNLTRLTIEKFLNKTNVESKCQNSLQKVSKQLKLRQPFINITNNIDIGTVISDSIKRNSLRYMPCVDITNLNIEKYLNNTQLKGIEMESTQDDTNINFNKSVTRNNRYSNSQNTKFLLYGQSYDNIDKTESILTEKSVKQLSQNSNSTLLEQIYNGSNESYQNINESKSILTEKSLENHSQNKWRPSRRQNFIDKTESILTEKTTKQLSQNSNSTVLEQTYDSNESYRYTNKSESILTEKSLENQSENNWRPSMRRNINSISSLQIFDNIDNSYVSTSKIDSNKFNKASTMENLCREPYITLRRRRVFLNAKTERNRKRNDTQNSSTFSDQFDNSKLFSKMELENEHEKSDVSLLDLKSFSSSKLGSTERYVNEQSQNNRRPSMRQNVIDETELFSRTESGNEHEKCDASSLDFKGFSSSDSGTTERYKDVQDKSNLCRYSFKNVSKDNSNYFSIVPEHKSVLVSSYLQEMLGITSKIMQNMSNTMCRDGDISVDLFTNDESQISNKINKTENINDLSIIDTSICEPVYQNRQIYSVKQNKRHRKSLFKEHTEEFCSFSNANNLINSFSDIIENTPIKVTKRRRVYYTPIKYIEIEESIIIENIPENLEENSKISGIMGESFVVNSITTPNNISTSIQENSLNPHEMEVICLDTPLKSNGNNLERKRLSEMVDLHGTTPNTSKLAGKSNEIQIIDSNESTPLTTNRVSLRRSRRLSENIEIKRLSFENDSEKDVESREKRMPRSTRGRSKKSSVNRVIEDDFKKGDEIECESRHVFAMPKLPSRKKMIKSEQDEGELKLRPGKLWRRSLVEIRNSKIGMSQIRKSTISQNNGDTICTCPNATPRRLSVRVVPLPTIQDTDKRTVLETYALSCRKSYITDALQESFLEECFENLSLTRLRLDEDQHDNYLSEVTARDVVLRKCGQTEPIQFEKCFPNSTLQHCQKIGEGVYGEVFLYRTPNGGTSVMKVIPIEGDLMVNGERQKKFEEILSEITIAMELSNLRKNTKNNTCTFSELRKVACVRGKYPERLLELWELYEEARGSENDHPSIFNEKQLYIVLELANGGKDMESFVFNNAQQAYALVTQIACALAVAESSLEFEHRDLHWGNVLISNVENKDKLSFCLNRKDIAIETHGIEIAIIDFTLSRITHEGVCIYNDLAVDPDLFTATGDYQFELYRLMQKQNSNKWQHFEPYSNILWLHYVLDKAISALRYKNKNSKVHKKFIKDMKDLKNEVLQYKSAEEFVLAKLINV